MHDIFTLTTDTVGATRKVLLDELGDSAESDRLLCHTLHCERAQLYAHPEEVLTATQQQQLTTLVHKRLAGVPLAQLTGVCEFFSLEFTVTCEVLIPRPATETLVEVALAQLAEIAPSGAQILELGTGCGAIAVAIAIARPDATLIACDNSRAALSVARSNANRHGVSNVSFMESDWYQQLPDARFHAIVSNPPYVGTDDPELDSDVASHEPSGAWCAENDGLACLEKVIVGATARLHAPGTLLIEHGHAQASAVARMMTQAGFEKVYCHTDLSGHPRVTVGCKPPDANQGHKNSP